MRPAPFAVEVAFLCNACKKHRRREETVFLVEGGSFPLVISVVAMDKEVHNPFIPAIRVQFVDNFLPPQKMRMVCFEQPLHSSGMAF